MREREREREIDRERERERETDRQTDRQTDRERYTMIDREEILYSNKVTCEGMKQREKEICRQTSITAIAL